MKRGNYLTNPISIGQDNDGRHVAMADTREDEARLDELARALGVPVSAPRAGSRYVIVPDERLSIARACIRSFPLVHR
jgi:hypothetical protein